MDLDLVHPWSLAHHWSFTFLYIRYTKKMMAIHNFCRKKRFFGLSLLDIGLLQLLVYVQYKVLVS